MQTETRQRDSETLPDEPYYIDRRRGEGARRWGALLLVVGVIWLVFELTLRGSLLGFGLAFVERSAELPAQTYAAARVVVRGTSDEIELVGWNEDGVQVAGVRHGFGWNGGSAEETLEQVEVTVSQNGDTLTVEVRRPPAYGIILGRSPYAELRISLPAGVSVDAQTVNGDLQADGLRADAALATVSGDMLLENIEGNLTINTTSGDVELEDLRGALTMSSVSGSLSASGDISASQIETVSGDVDLTGVRGNVSLNSISGDLDLAGARGASLDLESTSGDISVAGALAGNSRISNISGDVEVRLIDPRGLQLDVSTISGDLETDLPNLTQERRSLRGSIGAGGTVLTIGTTSGDVDVWAE